MIIGEQIKLRHIKEEDKEMYHQWINDRDLVHYNATFYPISSSDHNDWFNCINTKEDGVIFSIVTKDNDSLIGSCSLRNINTVHRNAELQIRIGESTARGNGHGTESVSLLLSYAFEDLNLERVYLHVFASNDRAIKSYIKAGLVEDGNLRKAAFINGAYVDVKVMSILREEFEDKKK